MFFEKESHDLHFHSDHSPHSNIMSPNGGGHQSNETNVIKNNVNDKKEVEPPKGGISGLKSLISMNKTLSSPQIQLKKDMDLLSDKTEINDLDKLFIKNYDVGKKKKVKRTTKKLILDENIETIEKKVKTEDKS